MRPRPRSTVALAVVVPLIVAAATSAVSSAAGSGAPTRAVGASTVARTGPPVLPLPRPQDFVARVSHPYLPMTPGTRWVYAGLGREKGERNVVTVLRRTRVIEGITATVVHDVVEEDGELVEDTHDWYAQDRLGNVWYLGERTREYEDGEVTSREGSWEAGKGDARAGIAMPASATSGLRYRQEFDPGNAEDQAEIALRRGRVRVPVGRFGRVRVTDETTPLDPAADELKFYARGVGQVMEIAVSPRFSRSVLVRMRRG